MTATAVVVVFLILTAAAAFAAVQANRARRAIELLRIEHERANRAEHARDAFFDLATHELRSPLAAILGYQELLQDGAYGEMEAAAAEPVVRIGRSARHLLHLIDGVVELSRLRAGSLHPDIEPVNTAVLMSGVAEAFRTQARDRSLDPHIELQPDLPVIRSDPDRLLRALDLLVASAIKHPQGREMHLEARSAGHDLEVRIHPTDLTFRDDDEDPELRLGIRLAVATRVAELLGGGLDLDNADGGGTITGIRFRVRDLDTGES